MNRTQYEFQFPEDYSFITGGVTRGWNGNISALQKCDCIIITYLCDASVCTVDNSTQEFWKRKMDTSEGCVVSRRVYKQGQQSLFALFEDQSDAAFECF